MATPERPAARPVNPSFSAGPTAKPPGWTAKALEQALLGRSHRAPAARARLRDAIAATRRVLGVPDSHRIAIVPGSDTGAMEMALWSMLGPRGVDFLAWESFGLGWANDVVKELRLPAVRVLDAPYGALPDLSAVNFACDVVFAWNGTTSGVRVPDGAWIDGDRPGLTICDATSAAFAQPLPFDKLDVATFSWQKALGGEAQHGMLILSPRAVERLETYSPPWPLPKIFRMTKGGRLTEGLFDGDTINTPSMLCVEDYLLALAWAERLGGLDALIRRADENAAMVAAWVARTPWVEFLARDPATRSNTSVCLTIADAAAAPLGRDGAALFAKAICERLEGERVAYDIAAHRDAPPGLRLWCGATVERTDIEALLPWLDWAFEAERAALRQAA
jgi:phosphoserine aminotransferase